MSDPTLVFVNEGDGGVEVVVNFGVFSGREATPAEIERLAQALLAELESVEIVCEQRFRFDRQTEGTVYQVKVALPEAEARRLETVADAAESWARDCIAERSVL